MRFVTYKCKETTKNKTAKVGHHFSGIILHIFQLYTYKFLFISSSSSPNMTYSDFEVCVNIGEHGEKEKPQKIDFMQMRIFRIHTQWGK
jgi:hypothetical protein